MTSTTIKPCICGFCREDFKNLETFADHLQTHDTVYNFSNYLCKHHPSLNLPNTEKITCMKCKYKFQTICFLHDHICFQDGSYIYVSEDRSVYPFEMLSSLFDLRCLDNDSRDPSTINSQTVNGIGIGCLLKTVLKQLYKIETDNTETKSVDFNSKDHITEENSDICGASDQDEKNKIIQVTSGVTKEIKQNQTEIKQKSTVRTKRKKAEDSKTSRDTKNVKKLKRPNKKFAKTSKCDVLNTDSTFVKAAKMKQKPTKIKKKLTAQKRLNKSKEIQNNSEDGTRSEDNALINGDEKEILEEDNCVKQISPVKTDSKDMNQHIETEIQETDLNEKQNSGKNVISDKPKRKYTKHKKNENGVISEKNYQSESVGGLKTEKRTVESVIDDKPKRKYTKRKKSENCVSGETNDKSMSMGGIKSEKTARKYKSILYEKCTICEKSFSKSKMKYHIISHTDQRPYKCELCPKTYKYPKHLSYHMRTHSDKPSYYCEVCGEGFTVVERLKNHSFTHTDFRPFSCEICGAGFAKKSGLSRHMSVHTGKKKEQCDRCGMRFVNKYNLDLHISSVHKKERRFACDECDKTFVTNYELKCHIMSHSGVRPYKCTMCNADFIQRKELRRHMLKQHCRSLDEKKGRLSDSQMTTSQPEENNDVGYVIKVELEDGFDKGRYGNENITVITTEKSNDNLYLQQIDQPSVVTEEIHTDQNTSVTLNMCQYEPVSYNTVTDIESAIVIDDGTYLMM